MFGGNIFSAILGPGAPLRVDRYGNSNVLLLGTSENDPGRGGPLLTDSMMVFSINQTSHQIVLLSIPRDLWVTYRAPCTAGGAGKINAVYECALGTDHNGLNPEGGDESTAERMTAATVGLVIGMELQYVVHVNLSVVQRVVDAVGGIDITIASPDPRGILDRNFDSRCNYECFLVKYPNGPVHLTGTNAMWLVQARNNAEGYGLPRNNFDREASQRKVVTALKDRLSRIRFLANPLSVVNLADALGDDVHTTIQADEVKSFVNAFSSTATANIFSIDIQDDAPDVLTTGTGPDGSSIVMPTAGLFDYAALQAFTHELLTGQGPAIAARPHALVP
jgi:LCP family protein required for cell wall assembly